MLATCRQHVGDVSKSRQFWLDMRVGVVPQFVTMPLLGGIGSPSFLHECHSLGLVLADPLESQGRLVFVHQAHGIDYHFQEVVHSLCNIIQKFVLE